MRHTRTSSVTAVLGRRAQSRELLLDGAPGVLSGLDSVEVTANHELVDVDVRWARLEAQHGDLEESGLALAEGGLLGGLLSASGGAGGCLDSRHGESS